MKLKIDLLQQMEQHLIQDEWICYGCKSAIKFLIK